MRYCDDIVDQEGKSEKEEGILRWQLALEAALAGKLPEHPLWPAFIDAVQCYNIPHKYFFEMIEGQRSDLKPRHIQTFNELRTYCYQVASTVGLSIVRIVRPQPRPN